MKVTNNKVGGNLDVKSSRTDGAQAPTKEMGIGAARNKSVKDSSNVAVSERAQMMKKAKDIASEQSVDEAKVARLQQLIDSGKYNVDASKIADRLVDQHLMIPDDT